MPLAAPAAQQAALRAARRIAVLGIKPDDRAGTPAHDIPRDLKAAGYQILPVPTRYPEAQEILGLPVTRDLAALEGPVDILDVFLRPEQVPAYAEAMLALRPGMVWFQPGCLQAATGALLEEAGIPVAHSCIAVVQRQL